MNLKSILKIIFVNTVLILCVVFILNFIVYFVDIRFDKYFDGKSFDVVRMYHNFMSRDISEKNTYKSLIDNDEFRPVENTEHISSLPAIILFGCSFTYGSGLQENETFSHQLAKLTKQPIYNRAIGGWSVQHMLYQLRHKDFYEKINMSDNSLNPEYIIYMAYFGQKSRIFMPVRIFCVPCYTVFYDFNKKTKEFKLRKRTFITDKIIFYYPILFKLYDFISKKIPDKIEERYYEYLIACKKEQEKHMPNSKFALIFYDKSSELNEIYMNKLKDNGFIILTTEDFGINVDDPKYRQEDSHPNEFVWRDATSKIYEKLRN